jgi:hypothetical protein
MEKFVERNFGDFYYQHIEESKKNSADNIRRGHEKHDKRV